MERILERRDIVRRCRLGKSVFLVVANRFAMYGAGYSQVSDRRFCLYLEFTFGRARTGLYIVSQRKVGQLCNQLYAT